MKAYRNKSEVTQVKSDVTINLKDISKFIESAQDTNRKSNNTKVEPKQRSNAISTQTVNMRTKLKHDFGKIDTGGKIDGWSNELRPDEWFSEGNHNNSNSSNDDTGSVQILHTGYSPNPQFVDGLERRRIPDNRKHLYSNDLSDSEFNAYLESRYDINGSKNTDNEPKATTTQIVEDNKSVNKPSKKAVKQEKTQSKQHKQSKETKTPNKTKGADPVKVTDDKSKTPSKVESKAQSKTEKSPTPNVSDTTEQKNGSEEKIFSGKLDIIQIPKRDDVARARYNRRAKPQIITLSPFKALPVNNDIRILEDELEKAEKDHIIEENVGSDTNEVINKRDKKQPKEKSKSHPVTDSVKTPEPTETEDSKGKDAVKEQHTESAFMAPVLVPKKFKCARLNRQDVENLGYFVTITLKHSNTNPNKIAVHLRRYLAYEFDSELILEFNTVNGVTSTTESYRKFNEFVDNLHIVSYDLKAVIQTLSDVGLDLFQVSDRRFLDVAIISKKLRTFSTCFHKFTVEDLCAIYNIELHKDSSYNELLSEVYMSLVKDILFV